MTITVQSGEEVEALTLDQTILDDLFEGSAATPQELVEGFKTEIVERLIAKVTTLLFKPDVSQYLQDHVETSS